MPVLLVFMVMEMRRRVEQKVEVVRMLMIALMVAIFLVLAGGMGL